jgi:protein arginine N-methyltransferase 1
MGYFLLFEGMLDSVILARDKFLKPNGLLFPNRAKLLMAPIDDSVYKEEKFKFFTENKYGIKMSCMKEQLQNQVQMDLLTDKYIISEEKGAIILDIDISTVKLEDLEFASGYQFKMNYKCCMSGFMFWFDVIFSYGFDTVVLSTAPSRNKEV